MIIFHFLFNTQTEHLNQLFLHCDYCFHFFFLPLVYVTYFQVNLKALLWEDHLYSLIGLQCPTIWSSSPKSWGNWIPFIFWLNYFRSLFPLHILLPKIYCILAVSNLIHVYSLIWINYNILWGKYFALKIKDKVSALKQTIILNIRSW